MLFTVLISTMIAMSDNIPPSQMLRVPSALVDAVKELSRLHRSGYTSAVLTGLQQLIASIDSAADSVVSVAGGKSDTELLAELIAGLDERIATQVAVQVAQLEQRLSTQLEDLKPRHDDLRKLPDAWAEVSELRSRLAASEQCQQDLMFERGEAKEDCKRFRFENEQILADRDRLEAAITEQRKQLASVRSQLEDQATHSERWYGEAKTAQGEIERLQQRQSPLRSLPIAQGELPDNTPESQANQSKPLVAESEQLKDIADAGNTLENISAPATTSNESVEQAAPSLGSLTPLSATKLAKRLDVAQSNVTRNRDKEGEQSVIQMPSRGSIPQKQKNITQS